MSETALFAISPIDGRYAQVTAPLRRYFAEAEIMRARLMVEVEYLIALRDIPIPQLEKFPAEEFKKLRDLYKNYSTQDAEEIKAIEKKINHDVKAVEVFIRQKLENTPLQEAREFTHFALTSQDINNTAFPIVLRDAIKEVYLPLLKNVIDDLLRLANEWANIPMLAKTHGQPASPTRLGKEIFVFADRLNNQYIELIKREMRGKFGGATGNFNAHNAAYPNVDWEQFANKFLQEHLGLQRLKVTTQIDTYDHFAETFDLLARINTILTDLCRDMWTYISMKYFKQIVVKDEVGSSAMPHKVNPIQFENAEGNLGLSTALFQHLARKLPISRLQRDLTDSTVIRNIGVPLAHAVIAIESIRKGLARVSPNLEAIQEDLHENWVVVAEGIQTVLRREGYDNAYEKLKDLTRKQTPPRKKEMEAFIDSLPVPENIKQELKSITPENYVGILPQFTLSDR